MTIWEKNVTNVMKLMYQCKHLMDQNIQRVSFSLSIIYFLFLLASKSCMKIRQHIFYVSCSEISAGIVKVNYLWWKNNIISATLILTFLDGDEEKWMQRSDSWSIVFMQMLFVGFWKEGPTYFYWHKKKTFCNFCVCLHVFLLPSEVEYL